MKIILLILGGLIFGITGSHILSPLGPSLGFIIGLMIFVIAYCCLTVGDPPERSNLP